MEIIIAIAAFMLGAAGGYWFGRNTSAQQNAVLATKLEAANETASEKTVYHERAVQAEALAKSLELQLQQRQEQLKLEFKTLSSTLFEDMSVRFSTQSEKKIGDLLNPLQLHLNDFKKLVGDSFSEQGKEQRSLQAEIRRIVEMNETMRLQTDSLTRALRGDVKAQGNWGEVILERILEESGLRAGEDYTLQGAQMGLTDAEGGRQQPDVVVHLPDNKHIIVDAKVSLVAYERYCAEADEAARDIHRKEFLKSVKAHINGLETKRYQHNEKLQTPDFVLMFMPIEGAYSFAVQQDSELHAYAWGKKIVLVCPATLFATLRTVASLWNIERQNRNSQKIARQGSALYDKFVGFVKDIEAIGEQIAKTQRTYDEAYGKLYTGRGNLVGQAEKLKEFGVKPSKSLPKFADEEEDDAEALPMAVAE